MRSTALLRTFLLAASCSVCGLVVVGCGDDGETDTGGGGNDGASSSSTGTNGVECDGATCDPSTQFCGFAAGTCEGPRTCQLYPECGRETVVCGCDGKNYVDVCVALEVSGGATADACAPPEGQFTCTYEYQIPRYCDLGTEYCKVTPSGGVYDLDCAPLPAACDDPPEDCSCTGDPCAENYCGIDDADGTMTILCPLPS